MSAHEPASPAAPRRPARRGGGGVRLPGHHQHRARQDLARASRRTACSGRIECRATVVATEIDPQGRRRPARASAPRDVLLRINGDDIQIGRRRDRRRSTRRPTGDTLTYDILRRTSETAFSVDAPADAARPLGSVLLARARRHPRARRRRVGPAAAAERSGDAAFLLADGRVLRRARVHAERQLQDVRLFLRLGRSGRAARAAAALPAFRAGVSRSAESVGADRRRPRGSAAALPAGADPRARPHCGDGGRDSQPAAVGAARADRDRRARLSGGVPAGRARPHDSRARPRPIGDRAAAAAAGSSGARRSARCRSWCCTSRRSSSARRCPGRNTRPCCSAAFRSRSRRPSCATG